MPRKQTGNVVVEVRKSRSAEEVGAAIALNGVFRTVSEIDGSALVCTFFARKAPVIAFNHLSNQTAGGNGVLGSSELAGISRAGGTFQQA